MAFAENNPIIMIGVAAFVCGVALFHLVMIRTHRRRMRRGDFEKHTY